MDKIPQSNGRDPREVVTQNTYDRVAAKYAHTRNGKRAWEVEMDALWGYLGKNVRILDIGCGSGPVLQHALEHRKPLSRYVGLDYSEAMLDQTLLWATRTGVPVLCRRRPGLTFLERPLERLRRFLRAPKAEVDLVCQPMQDMDPPTSYFDAVTMLASLHHLLRREDQETVLELCFHTLKPGGLLLLSVWHMPGDATGVVEVPFTDGDKKTPRYYWRFSRDELLERVLYAGFELRQDISRPEKPGFAWLLEKPLL